MSVDRSLKIKGSLTRHRNVLTRAERILSLQEQERFKEGDCPWGLPKVAHRKAPVGGKAKKAAKKEGEGAEAGVPGAPGAPAAAGAPAGAAAGADKKAAPEKKAAGEKKGGGDKKK
jgi:small basic protein (TIGR04137 family)